MRIKFYLSGVCVFFFFIIYFSFSRSPVDAIDIFGKTPPLPKVKGENLGYTQCAAAQCARGYTATAAVPLTGTFFFRPSVLNCFANALRPTNRFSTSDTAQLLINQCKFQIHTHHPLAFIFYFFLHTSIGKVQFSLLRNSKKSNNRKNSREF